MSGAYCFICGNWDKRLTGKNGGSNVCPSCMETVKQNEPPVFSARGRKPERCTPINDHSGPAFPLLEPPYHIGMTLRDWFAGQALADGIDGIGSPTTIASWCYEIADAMLEARKAKNND